MFNSIDLIIRICIVLVFAYGLWLFFGNSVSGLIREVVRKNSVLRKAKRAKRANSNKLIRHLTRVLGVVLKKDITQEVYKFLVGSVLLFAVSFIFTIELQGVSKAFLLSLFISLVPYLFLLSPPGYN